jgi:uncharacterized OB-fold protein
VALTRAEAADGTGARPRLDRQAGVLVGSRCADCGTRSWPARAVCSNCGSDGLTIEPLPHTASLLSYTTVWVPRPSLTVPYVLGQVEFGDGASVFAHVRELPEDARVPLPVSVVLSPDPDQTPSFWFEPTT